MTSPSCLYLLSFLLLFYLLRSFLTGYMCIIVWLMVIVKSWSSVSMRYLIPTSLGFQGLVLCSSCCSFFVWVLGWIAPLHSVCLAN